MLTSVQFLLLKRTQYPKTADIFTGAPYKGSQHTSLITFAFESITLVKKGQPILLQTVVMAYTTQVHS